MTATRYDFLLEAYSDTNFTVQVYQDDNHSAILPLDNWTAKLTIRDHLDSQNSPLMTLTSNPAAGLTINGPAGQIAVHISAAQAGSLSWYNAQWDLVVSDTLSAAVKRAAYGNVSVRAGATRG